MASKFMKNFVKINKEEAADFYNKVPFKTFFHNPDWQEFLEKEFKWLKFEHYSYKDEILLSFAKVDDKLISLPFCEYGGPLPIKQNIGWEDFNKDVLKEFQNIKIKFHPLVLAGDANCDVLTHFIDSLDKKNEKELWDSFRKTLRHSIRNAQENNLEIKKCSNAKELKKFYDLYVSTLKRKLTVPYPFAIIEHLFKQKDTEILLAFHKNKIIGGDLFLHYNGIIHYFLSVSDYKYRNLGVSYLILWEKIKKSLGRDYKIFDFGASPRGSNLEIFKRGWEGKEYPILQLGIQRSQENLRSSRLRKFWSLLPNFVVKKLSPYLIKYRI